MKLKLTPLLVALISFPSFAEGIPGQNLLKYFSANCRSQGDWTRTALADSSALIVELQNIQLDGDCKSVGGAVGQLQLLNQQLTALEKTNDTQVKIAEINAQEQELLIQISNNTNADTLASINAHLRELQVTRAGLIGKDKSSPDLASPDKAKTMASIVQIANTAFTQVTNNQTCLSKHPNVLNSATSVMSAVGATAMLVNPVLGLGLTAGSELLGATIEGVRRRNNAREIRNIADNSVASEAYKCALETMSENWCQMRDAESFLLFKAEQRQQSTLSTGLASAIRLNDREIPVLLEWLNRIKSGVAPTSTADANRQNAVREKKSYVESREAFGLALIEESKPIFQDETDPAERWNIIKGLITSIVPAHMDGWKNPLFDAIGSEGYAPFFLLGLNDDETLKNPTTKNYHTLETWTKPDTFNPTLELIKNRYEEWILKATTRVNKELAQVLQPDAETTLTSAFDRTGNRWKTSPMDALKRLIDFLDKNSPKEEDSAFRKLYASTLLKLKNIHRITEDAIISRDLTDNSSVKEIFEEAQLRFGTVVLEARLEMIVRLSLLELLENSDPKDQILVAQLLAAERFTETITKIKGTDNLARIQADILRGQPITISNLNSFMDIFGNNVNRILNKLKWEEESSTGTVAKAKRYARTEMCFLLLAVPDVDDYVDIKLCQGLKMNALTRGGPETITISQATFNQDMNDRACVYREFFRQSKIFETWGIK